MVDLLVEVDQGGHFETVSDDTNKLLSVGTVRIRLTQEHREAAGWLEMDELVRMSLGQRSIFSALSRFLSRQATEDDDIALLNYLAVSSSHHLEDLSHPDFLSWQPATRVVETLQRTY